jgi:hypothetical protein
MKRLFGWTIGEEKAELPFVSKSVAAALLGCVNERRD